eukprot:scaffold723_cov19-Tisochrysis_lutea.AAC.1
MSLEGEGHPTWNLSPFDCQGTGTWHVLDQCCMVGWVAFRIVLHWKCVALYASWSLKCTWPMEDTLVFLHRFEAQNLAQLVSASL